MTLSIGKEKVGDGTEIIEMLIKAFGFKRIRKLYPRTIYSSKSR